MSETLDRAFSFGPPALGLRRGVFAAALLLALAAAPLRAAVFALQHNVAPSPRASGYLGIEFHDVTDAEATALHEKGTRGVLIVAVDHDGPAGKAGLRAQDIIVSVNGQLAASAELVRRMIHDAGAGVSLGLALVRQGRTMAVTAVLADRHDVEQQAMARVSSAPAPVSLANAADPVDTEEGNPHFADPAPPTPPHGPLVRSQAFIGAVLHGPFTGLELEVMTPQLAGFFGASGGKGLLVQTVAANSPASDAGIRAGDVIVRADGTLMASTALWTKHLRASKGGPIVLTVLRDRQEQQIILTLEKKHSLLVWPQVFGAE